MGRLHVGVCWGNCAKYDSQDPNPNSTRVGERLMVYSPDDSCNIEELDIQLRLEAELATEALPLLRRQYHEANAEHGSSVNSEAAFSYASLLVKASNAEEQKLGITLLNRLIELNYHVEDCLMLMVTGYYVRKEYALVRDAIYCV